MMNGNEVPQGEVGEICVRTPLCLLNTLKTPTGQKRPLDTVGTSIQVTWHPVMTKVIMYLSRSKSRLDNHRWRESVPL